MARRIIFHYNIQCDAQGNFPPQVALTFRRSSASFTLFVNLIYIFWSARFFERIPIIIANESVMLI